MGVINNKDMFLIIFRALKILDKDVVAHGKVVGYIFYKMLEYENQFFLQELIDYTTIGVLHDIGLCKSSDKDTFHTEETKHVWRHSIYGYLFLRYLSPLGEKAEIVLYHHLDYSKYPLIHSKYIKIAEYLAFADKLDFVIRSGKGNVDAFAKQSGISYSDRARQLFLKAERKFHIFEAIHSGRYEDELQELMSKKIIKEEEKRTYLKMVIYTIDFRSEYTVLHSMATTTFAMELARIMNLKGEDIYNLYYGALLHDIGKLVTPTEILEAPRRLTDDEMAIMKEHVANTEKILRGVISDDIVEIAIRHHEKMDGSGYHRGIPGQDLTLPQRIVAVADIISALYEKRSYKDALDIETIRGILQKDSDAGKLCPKVVGCAVRNMEYLIRNFEGKKDKVFGTYLLIKEQYKVIYEKFKRYESDE